MTDVSFVDELAAARVLAIIRGSDAGAVAQAAVALAEEGIRFVELPLTTPGALAAIEHVVGRVPHGVSVGAGTVLTRQQATDAAAAGASFIVTPALVESIEAAAARGMPVVAGALTPSEALAARTRGADVVKIFPASTGGPAYLKALREPLPDIPFVAVGGVGLEDVAGYLAAGAIGVGVGSPLVGDAVTGGDLGALRQRARAYLRAVEGSSR